MILTKANGEREGFNEKNDSVILDKLAELKAEEINEDTIIYIANDGKSVRTKWVWLPNNGSTPIVVDYFLEGIRLAIRAYFKNSDAEMYLFRDLESFYQTN